MPDSPIVIRSICPVIGDNQPPASVVPNQQGCCYQSKVLADISDSADFKNDVNSVIVKRNFSSETVTLTLEKDGGSGSGGTDYALNDNTYGQFYNFGSLNSNQIGYLIEWRKVLTALGEGVYRVKVEANYITGNIETYSIPFKLLSYTPDRANGTFRLQSIQNGYLREFDLDLTGLNWKDGLRVEGFFGNRVPEYTDERVVYSNDQARQIRNDRTDTFTCQSMYLPECITTRLVDYHFSANYLLATDYNFNNHVKRYLNRRVILDNFDSFEYNPRTDKAKIEAKFKDYDQISRKINC